MAKWLPTIRVRRSLWLAAVAVGVCAYPLLPAQGGAAPGRDRSREPNGRMLARPASRQALAAAGVHHSRGAAGLFRAGSVYLGQRNSFVSLDFLDEDRLLFTFRVPGLIHRDAAGESEERQIRAVVLALPSGNGGGRGPVDGARPGALPVDARRTATFCCATGTILSRATPRWS